MKAILPKIKLVYLLWLLVPLLLWLALKDIQWAEVVSALLHLQAWQILALVALNIIVLFFFSGGWWLILRAQGYPISLWRLTLYRVAAFGVSYFTPGPQFGGEPLQVYLLTRNHNVPVTTATAATALDKVLELLVNFLFLAEGILLIGQWNLVQGVSLTQVLIVVGALVVSIFLFLFVSWLGWLPVTRGLRALPIKSERYQHLVNVAEASERQVSEFCRAKPLTLIGATLMVMICWALILFEYWLAMDFLGLALNGQQLITAVTINRIAFLAPLPGGLGALEGSQVLAMTVLGLDPAIGVSQGLIIRARDVAVGLVGLAIGWDRARR